MPPPFATNLRTLQRTGAFCDELEQAAIPAIHQGKPLPLGFRADILADETVILEIKAVPALLRAHDTKPPWMMTLPSSRAVGMRTGLVGRRAKTQLQT